MLKILIILIIWTVVSAPIGILIGKFIAVGNRKQTYNPDRLHEEAQ